MYGKFKTHLQQQLSIIRDAGLYKEERIITSPQAGRINVTSGDGILNFCANNYLGLANDPKLVDAAKQALDKFGYGMASVRFICGTQDIHKELEKKLAEFLGMEDTILYSSCYDANAGLFETFLDERDAILSDALNHASIIDGVRLCKAQRFRYANNDMTALEAKLKEAAGARFRLIATDGVFSMDGSIANLSGICDLAEKYDSMVMVDDSHAVGLLGDHGRGSAEYCGVEGRVDLMTGTLGKALGGASGGYTVGKAPLIDWLRQRSRPYLFSNTLAPVIAATTLTALDLIEAGDSRRRRLQTNAQRFRAGMTALGFTLVPGSHPIIPVILGEERLAQEMAAMMLERGVFVTGFSYPVVPKGQARVRVQMSADHSEEDVNTAIEAFAAVGCELSIIGEREK